MKDSEISWEGGCCYSVKDLGIIAVGGNKDLELSSIPYINTIFR